MEPIANTEDLQAKRAAGEGYIYNDDQGGVEMHVFHRATCTTLARAKVPPRKWFSLDLQDALNWLHAYRGQEDVNWHRCDT